MGEHSSITITELTFDKNRTTADNPLKIQDLSFRDGHQSLFATRGRTEDMLPVAERMDDVGFWAMETWGGATFDAMHRFLNEDPWQRLRTLKKYIKKTPFSMLLRGQNLVGYRNYADDVCRTFVQRASENGVDIFRTFDALNDYRNFETVVPAIKKAGKHFQGCICYTLTQPRLGGEVYNRDYYIGKTKELESLGADSICIKDMAGLFSPYDAFTIVSALKASTAIPIHFHSHCTSGLAPMSQLKAIEAGVDIIDTCLSPYANRTSHPPVEPVVMTLLGTNRDTGFDIKLLVDINKILERDVMPKYRRLLSDEKVSLTDINVLLHQTPGGMLSNLINQLREMDAVDKLEAVYDELPRVRKELGQPPLVTPTSQIVGVQTVNNVLFDSSDERYTRITDQVKDLCYGLYGRTPAPIDPAIRQKALKGYPRGQEPISCRPGEILEPELDKAREEIKDISSDIDDILLCALYPLTGKRFLKWKYGLEAPPPEVLPKSLAQAKGELDLIAQAKAGNVIPKKDKKAPEGKESLRSFDVYVDGEYFKVEVGAEGTHAVAAPAKAQPAAPPPQSPAPTPQPEVAAEGTAVTAPLPGMVVSIAVNQGDTVTAGDTVVVLEAMKMENAIPAPADGTVVQICVKSGDKVKKDDVLFVMA